MVIGVNQLAGLIYAHVIFLCPYVVPQASSDEERRSPRTYFSGQAIVERTPISAGGRAVFWPYSVLENLKWGNPDFGFWRLSRDFLTTESIEPIVNGTSAWVFAGALDVAVGKSPHATYKQHQGISAKGGKSLIGKSREGSTCKHSRE
jgi:hypothetical protein